jgi:hypothetical protein
MTRAERETYGAKSGKAPAIRLWRSDAPNGDLAEACAKLLF